VRPRSSARARASPSALAAPLRSSARLTQRRAAPVTLAAPTSIFGVLGTVKLLAGAWQATETRSGRRVAVRKLFNVLAPDDAARTLRELTMLHAVRGMDGFPQLLDARIARNRRDLVLVCALMGTCRGRQRARHTHTRCSRRCAHRRVA